VQVVASVVMVPLFVLVKAFMCALTFSLVSTVASEPSGMYFFSDPACQVPVSVEPNGDPTHNFLPVVNALETNYVATPYLGERLSTSNCLTLQCHIAPNWSGVLVEPTLYNPKEERVWAILGGGHDPTGLCDHPILQGQLGSWDLSCSDRGNGTYIYLDCFGAASQFPPDSWAPANSSSSTASSQDFLLDFTATGASTTDAWQSDVPSNSGAETSAPSSLVVALSLVSGALLVTLVAVIAWTKCQRPLADVKQPLASSDGLQA
jgi:hypothetical protein